MATGKQYVDLAGLTTFSTSLKNKLAANTLNDWVVNYASNAGKATSDGDGANIASTYLTKDDATNTYVPLTRTITSLALSTDITAEALRTQLNVEDGSEKNKIVAITIDNVPQNPDGERKVALDLSNYAKKSDITAVLKFKGVVSDVSALPEASKDQVGHVYIVTSASDSASADKDSYAEYVCVDNNGDTTGGYTWEKLGNGASLDGYFTKEEINAKFNELSLGSTGAEGSFINTISQIAGKVSASATAFATSVAENGKVAPTSGAVYTAIEGAKSTLMGTGAGDTGSTIKKNEAAIATLNGGEAVNGSVAKKIKDVIGGLTGTQSEGYYVTSVTQADGKVTVTRENKGTVADGNTGLVDGGAVHSFVTTHVTNAIQGLDAGPSGGDGQFLSAIFEANGKILSAVKTFDITIPDSNPSTVVAPTTSAFKDYSDSVYAAISSVSSEEISQLFIPKSKTRDLITGTIKVAESDSVTSIGDYAFYKYSTLTSVSFPNATSIGTYAFYSCKGLTSVSFPEVTSIGGSAFYYCSGLTEVSFPNAKSIGEVAFRNCSKLTSVSFPNATSTGDSTFRGSNSLTSVSFPKATRIGGIAFQDCSGLTRVSFPEVTIIGSSAFLGCSKLTEASFPNATSIENGAFQKCTELTTIYVGTNTSKVCTLSSTSAFTGCTNLANIYVPETLVNLYKTASNWSSFTDKIKAYTGV